MCNQDAGQECQEYATHLGCYECLKAYYIYIFGSDRSPRRGDLVCACVRACVILFKITVKMSSSSILKSPGGSASKHACMQASKQAGKHANTQVSKHASKQASEQTSEQASK